MKLKGSFDTITNYIPFTFNDTIFLGLFVNHLKEYRYLFGYLFLVVKSLLQYFLFFKSPTDGLASTICTAITPKKHH